MVPTLNYVVAMRYGGLIEFETRLFRINLTKRELGDAYNKGIELLGVNIQSYRTDFEPLKEYNPVYFAEIIKDNQTIETKLAGLGFSQADICYKWCEIVLKVCQLGNPDLRYEPIDTDYCFEAGGYCI